MHLNKLIVKIMSVLLQHVFQMIMKELIISGFFIQRPVWCLLCENINVFNVFNLIVVLKVAKN